MLLLFGCLLTPSVAQVDRAGLSGTVSDAAGAVIPGIHVVVTMPETGRVRETETSRAGTYEIPQLPVGTCSVTYTGNGFATLVFNHVILTVGQTRTQCDSASGRRPARGQRVQPRSAAGPNDRFAQLPH